MWIRITKDENYKREINDIINKGEAAISKVNSILWHCYVTSKTNTHIHHAVLKITIIYAAET